MTATTAAVESEPSLVCFDCRIPMEFTVLEPAADNPAVMVRRFVCPSCKTKGAIVLPEPGARTAPKSLEELIQEKTRDVEVGTIALEDAALCYDFDREVLTRPVADLKVFDKNDPSAATLWDAAANGWRFGSQTPWQSPLGIFANMAFGGLLPTGDPLIDILREFAKIRGCAWSVQMIAGIREGHSRHDL